MTTSPMAKSRRRIQGISAVRIRSMSAPSRASDASTSRHSWTPIPSGQQPSCTPPRRPITAADMLNDKVLPFFEEQDMGVLRILTDRGTEYCGNVETHDYELFLGVCGIEHTKTKARHPQTNGICERFHKTILDEFYRVTFRAQALPLAGVLTGRFGPVDRRIQHAANAPGENVLRTDAHDNYAGRKAALGGTRFQAELVLTIAVRQKGRLSDQI